MDELLGTKFRALYQRKKGRDLFDLYKALQNPNLNIENMIKCYYKYMSFADGKTPSQAVYLANMEEKMQKKDFLNDTIGLLRPELKYSPQVAYEIVKKKLIEKL
jgi:predicted nucleotidyltransferase component of viral defense system